MNTVKREFIPVFFLLLVLSIIFTSSQTQTSFSDNDCPIHSSFIANNLQINELQNANFSVYVNKTDIVRGEDDLLIHFKFHYLNNASLIPKAEIHFNVSDESSIVIFSEKLLVNTTEYFSYRFYWHQLIQEKAGNYTIYALANSTTTDTYFKAVSFNLITPSKGVVRMYFPGYTQDSPIFALRNRERVIQYRIANIGDSMVFNLRISGVEKSGTAGSMSVYFSQINLTLLSGQIYTGSINVTTEGPLYQIVKFTIDYVQHGDPPTYYFVSSDPIRIITQPYVTVSNLNFQEEAQVREIYLVNYRIQNTENTFVSIKPEIYCLDEALIKFNNYSSFILEPGFRESYVSGEVLEASDQAYIMFIIYIEWFTLSGVNWYYPIFVELYDEAEFLPLEEEVSLSSITLMLVFIGLFSGVGYFSRNVIKDISKKALFSEKMTKFDQQFYSYSSVILDGSNIAWDEKSTDNKPKIANILAMINRLSQANFTKIITVADAALRYQIDEQKKLDNLVKDGAIKMLPARVDGDKFILRLAEQEDSMIVSNDLFKEYRTEAPWIDERRIPYTILDGEVYLHPTSVESVKEMSKKESNTIKIEENN